MNNKAKKLLEKIKKEHVTPKPKIYFILKNILFWIVCVMSILLVVTLASAITYRVILLYQYNPRLIHFIIIKKLLSKSIPLLWLLVLAVSIYLIVYSIRHTKRGYKYPSVILLSTVFGLLAIILFIFHIVGLPKTILNQFETHKLMKSFSTIEEQVWNNPKNGVLRGFIYSLPKEDSNKFELEVFKQSQSKHSIEKIMSNYPHSRNISSKTILNYHDIWEIQINDNTKAHPFLYTLHPYTEVKIIGRKIDNFVFEADKIYPTRRLNNRKISNVCLDILLNTQPKLFQDKSAKLDNKQCKKILLKKMLPFKQLIIHPQREQDVMHNKNIHHNPNINRIKNHSE